MCISAFGPCSSPLRLLPCWLYIRDFSYVLLVAIFSLKLFGFSCIRLSVDFRIISPNFLVEFAFVFVNVLFCLYCLTIYRYLFNLPSFYSTFWFISLYRRVFFFLCGFSLFSLHVPVFYLCSIIFACFNRFLIWVSSQTSHQVLIFFFVLFIGIQIFS